MELFLNYSSEWQWWFIGTLGEVDIASGATMEEAVKNCLDEIEADGGRDSLEIIGPTSNIDVHRWLERKGTSHSLMK